MGKSLMVAGFKCSLSSASSHKWQASSLGCKSGKRWWDGCTLGSDGSRERRAGIGIARPSLPSALQNLFLQLWYETTWQNSAGKVLFWRCPHTPLLYREIAPVSTNGCCSFYSSRSLWREFSHFLKWSLKKPEGRWIWWDIEAKGM